MATRQHTGQRQNADRQQPRLQQTVSGKSLIDKDNLRDEDFDKLVIEISNLILVREESQHNSQEVDCNASVEEARGQEFAANSGAPEADSSHRLKDQPKRPMNAFMVWGRAIRREIHHRFSNVQNALLSKALGRVWRSLDSAAKEPYLRKANLIKANHRRDYPDYRYQPRRIQERERGNKNKLDVATTSIIADTNHPTSQYFVAPHNTMTNCQPSGSQPGVSIYHPTIINEHMAPRRVARFEPSGSGRFSEQEARTALPSPKHCYVPPGFPYQDNNNYLDSGFRNGIYCTGCVASGDMQHPKVQYYDEYHSSQQWRS